MRKVKGYTASRSDTLFHSLNIVRFGLNILNTAFKAIVNSIVLVDLNEFSSIF